MCSAAGDGTSQFSNPPHLQPDEDAVELKVRRLGLAKRAVVRDLREHQSPVASKTLERFQTHGPAGLVLVSLTVALPFLADHEIRERNGVAVSTAVTAASVRS
ncbi:hypothetical protein U9R90_18915 [Streptomyces sp. E11-3]|uniref:hypothetical protein n=1 Tax=Streptomyces sp. E11-3 TaxID=3110112 RepID=UPI003980A93A